VFTISYEMTFVLRGIAGRVLEFRGATRVYDDLSGDITRSFVILSVAVVAALMTGTPYSVVKGHVQRFG